MKKSHLAALVAALSLSPIANPSYATTVSFDNGSTSLSDCTLGCTTVFQSVYAASAFGSAPVSVNSISFYLGQTGTISDTYTFTLSTSKNSVGNLSANAASNLGNDAATFYVGVPSVSSSGSWVSFAGTPFTYNPLLGDLLVQITHPNGNDQLYSSYNSNTNEQRDFVLFGNAYVENPGYEINTKFEVSAAAVPEPASWAMMVGGFGLMGAAMRRKKAAVSFA
ncbi:PEPxxWA-CTERM sorting domain-containing protein [Sphingomonas bacterium]|uniref:PEPxxWA-CTERM sorting domain-containing protein n=1 Tax=Sphingomonas bacterium TaxID=1895847 RepID=UPI0015776931|nr:PEPxxWA-CTERM sorting domain-containing protein [Sphingomonas bacterium]